jgi:hypothetical protein
MLKFTSVIMGILAAGSIAQPTFAMSAANRVANVNLPASNRQAQLIIKIGGNNGGGYESEREIERRRYLERERQIERERWEARRRHMERERYEYRRGYAQSGYRHDGYRHDQYRNDDYHRDGYRR